MKALFFLLLSLLLLAAGASSQPGQPYSSYWFPSELLTWTPAGDPDAPFNRGWIQLSPRSLGDSQANAHARPDEAGIAALSIMYPSTSGNPSQGANVFDVYAFNYWQYTDRLVLWGGSAGEGIILSPSADVIDAGHRNGVPIYGTVFFPPTQYGGNIQWVWDFVQESGGTYPVADKLIEVAEYYGFEGWFINQETAGGNSDLATEMRNLMEYVHLNSDVRIMWYDAMVETGGISWQNALNSNNDMFFEDGGIISDEMFLNFWWSSSGLSQSAAYATGLGRSPYELYAGVDVQANGYNTSVNWNGIFPEANSHVTSLGFYCPNWCYSSSSSHEDFIQRANRFWIGANRDPSNTETSHSWKGMAHYVPATTPITEVPFVTTFNTGQGHLFSIDGAVSGTHDWNNRSLQDVLPTWRWIADSPGTPLYPQLDWTDAFWGGSCLNVSGDLFPGSPTMLYLYKTDLVLSSSDRLLVAFTTGIADTPSNIEVALAFENPEIFEYLPIGDTWEEGWNSLEMDLSAYSGRQLSVVALRFETSVTVMDYQARIGQLGIISGSQDVPSPPSNLYVEDFQQIDDDHGTVRLRWTHSPDQAHMYAVFRVNSDSTRTWLGGSPSNAYFVPEVIREPGETNTVLEVVTVGNEFGVSSAVETSISWVITGIEESSSPFSFGLRGNFSNPVVTDQSIEYSIGCSGPATLMLYGLDGRLTATLAQGNLNAGNHVAQLETAGIPIGIYFIRLMSGGESDTRKIVLLR